jgi:hypothetical protein
MRLSLQRARNSRFESHNGPSVREHNRRDVKKDDVGDRSVRRGKSVGLTLPDVTAGTRYDGSPVLKVHGCFMAGLAMHESAEPDTLVVRVGLEERVYLLEDAPDTYYLTDYYRRYPLVLVRLAKVDRDALRDLLSVSWRLTMAKSPNSRQKIRP